jgi:hypothetical protein
MKMANPRWLAPLCAAPLALIGAGCGSSSSSSSAASSRSAPAATSSPASGGATSTSSASGTTSGAGITAPGATLPVGQTATVPFQDPGTISKTAPSYKLMVTVDSISKASLSDFKGIELDANEKASTPYYVRFKITNVGSGDLGTKAEAAIEGVDNTGEGQTSVTFIGDFPPCNDTTPPKPFTHGKTWSTCQVYMVPGGITAAQYDGGSLDSYIEKPVTWK